MFINYLFFDYSHQTWRCSHFCLFPYFLLQRSIPTPFLNSKFCYSSLLSQLMVVNWLQEKSTAWTMVSFIWSRHTLIITETDTRDMIHVLWLTRWPSIISRPDKCNMLHVIGSPIPHFHNGSTKVYRNDINYIAILAKHFVYVM